MNSKTASLAAALGMTCGLLACGTAMAARPGFYAGGSFSMLNRTTDKADFDSFTLNSVYIPLGLTPVSVGHSSVDSHDTGFGFVAGYRFLKHLSAEFEYIDLGKFTSHAVDTVSLPGDVFPVSTDIEKRISGLGISALGILPLSENWEIFGRAGVLLTSERVDVLVVDDQGGGAFGSDNGSNTALMVGAGVSVTFAKNYSFRVEYREVFDAGDKDLPGRSDIGLLSAGILVQF